jgi:hypothetical protein
VFSIFKKKHPRVIGDLYVSQTGDGAPELFADFDRTAFAGIANERYVTMRVIVVKPDRPQK